MHYYQSTSHDMLKIVLTKRRLIGFNPRLLNMHLNGMWTDHSKVILKCEWQHYLYTSCIILLHRPSMLLLFSSQPVFTIKFGTNMGISIIPSRTKFQWVIHCLPCRFIRNSFTLFNSWIFGENDFGMYLIVTNELNSTSGFIPHSRLKHSEKVVNSHLFVTYVSFMCHWYVFTSLLKQYEMA